MMKYQFEVKREIRKCESCPAFYWSEIDIDNMYCEINDRIVKDENVKPKWCPLIEVGEGE